MFDPMSIQQRNYLWSGLSQRLIKADKLKAARPKVAEGEKKPERAEWRRQSAKS